MRAANQLCETHSFMVIQETLRIHPGSKLDEQSSFRYTPTLNPLLHLVLKLVVATRWGCMGWVCSITIARTRRAATIVARSREVITETRKARGRAAGAAVFTGGPRVSYRLPGAKLLTQASNCYGAGHSKFGPLLHGE